MLCFAKGGREHERNLGLSLLTQHLLTRDLMRTIHTAMTAPAAPADVKDDLLLQIRRLLDKSKPELQKEWKEVNCSDFEPVAKPDLLANDSNRPKCIASNCI